MRAQAQSHKTNRVSNKPYDGNPTLWSVVAFQDEITRSLNLSDPTTSFPKTRKPAPRTLPPLDSRPSASRSVSSVSPSTHSSSTSSRSLSTSSRSPPASSRSPSQTTPSRHAPSVHAPASRSPMSRTSPSRTSPSAASAKANRQTVKAKEGDIIVVEQKKQNLTLAQKMGLTPSPPMPLSNSQWEEVKKISDTRYDSYMPCVICQDEFRTDGQVLLSCSHVFHKICLDSFEKYSKTKSCPLCRKQEYQKAQIFEGEKVYKHKCATRIQAVYRGYRARKLFQQLLDDNPPEDAERRKAFYARKLERVTDQLLRRIDQDRAAIDSSIHAMNHNVAASIAYLRSVGIGSMLNPNSIDWKDVTAQAKERNTHDCPICIMPLHPGGRAKPVTLLSCSHVFHDTCIASFEHYNCETVHLCPVCRSMYHKTKF